MNARAIDRCAVLALDVGKFSRWACLVSRAGEALKAVARKRLKVIYAVMRDKVPYRP